MDLLERLQLEDLPEQQTRIMHLMNESTEPPNSLGFEHCANCGKVVVNNNTIQCDNCRRITYCSESCRQKDANVEITEEGALGHTAIICSLLKLCNEDDAVEDENTAASTDHAARDRVRSEYESYAATLANVLSDGPCYQETFQKSSSLKIHLIGASDDAELTRGAAVVTDNSPIKVIQDYADACAELAERNEIQTIQLIFVGPDCPSEPWDHISMPLRTLDKTVGEITAQTFQGVYHEVISKQDVPAADIVVFYHPGFTVPDYDSWADTLAAIPPDTPFLLTSNTEMEAIADAQYLLEQDCVRSLPAGLSDILEVEIANEDSFFAVNPFHGMRVRQNQSMANDVYVKNRWMLGGVMGPLRLPVKADDRPATKRRVNAGLI